MQKCFIGASFIALNCNHQLARRTVLSYTLSPNTGPFKSVTSQNPSTTETSPTSDVAHISRALHQPNWLVSSKVSFGLWNTRSLKNKISFFQSIYTKSLDVFLVTEAWLSDSIFNNELLPTDYTVYHCDRESHHHHAWWWCSNCCIK